MLKCFFDKRKAIIGNHLIFLLLSLNFVLIFDIVRIYVQLSCFITSFRKIEIMLMIFSRLKLTTRGRTMPRRTRPATSSGR